MQKKIGKLDSGKVYILTMRNDVAHSTAIKMEAARFCKKVGQPGCITCHLQLMHYIYAICMIVHVYCQHGNIHKPLVLKILIPHVQSY